MTDIAAVRPPVDMWDYRQNLLDPLVDRLLGAGKPFALEKAVVGGYPQLLFRGAPRTLTGVYARAMDHAARDLVVHEGRTLSYAEAFARAGSLAAILRDHYGVRRGNFVALAMSNRPEFIISLIAITAAGGIAALINSRGVAAEMLRAIETCGCTLAILDAERADVIAARYPEPARPRIIVGTPTEPLRDIDMGFDAATSGDASLLPVEVDPTDGAIVLFTSGTTGFPKGAQLSHGAVAHAIALSSFMGALQDLRYEVENDEALPENRRSMTSPTVILPPMFHLSGMLPIFRSISVGTTIHIMGKWNVDIAYDTLEQTGMSRLSFVPAMLWDMFRSPRATPETLGQIRYMVNGGAPLNPDIVAEIRRRTPKVLLVNTYGQSENCAWACSISGRPYLDNPSSCGWAVPSVRVAVRREDGSEAAIGEPGEIWTSGASTMTGYVGDPAATEAALRDGWLATGDIGFVDPSGLFSIVDRKKNMVISGGENIYCAEVERVLSLHPAVLECLTYGEPDTRLGESLAAVLYVDPEARVSEEDIKAHCRKHLAIYKVPRAVHFQDTPLPRTASGKIERRRA
jgi:long-chain acyl-CoA synthetase